MVSENDSIRDIYSTLDTKIESVRRELSQDVSDLRAEFGKTANIIIARIDGISGKRGRRKKQEKNKSYQLIGTAIGLLALFGSAITFVSSGLQKDIDSVRTWLEKVEEVRLNSVRQIYDAIGKLEDKAYSKAAHQEFAARIDERDRLEQDYAKNTTDKIDRSVDQIVADIVPRKEHEQRWADEKEEISRMERSLESSISRVSEHLNKSDELAAANYNQLASKVNGYGLTDEVKQLDEQNRILSQRVFDILRILGPDKLSGKPGE
jgi:hypothetical protein